MNELTVREYLGNRIEFKMIEGHVYANANQMAYGFGGSKKLENWKSSPNTKRYIEALTNSLKSRELKLIDSIEGRNGGTWIHEKLVLNFARYLNVEFELWCDEQIETLLREGKVELNQEEHYSLEEKLLLNIIHSESNEETALAMKTYRDKIVKPLMIENKKQKEYIDHVVINEKYYITPSQIGNKFDMSAQALNKTLNKIGIIYKKGQKWYLTSEYYGIADYRYFQKPNGEWEKGNSLCYCNEGEKLIFEILIAHGYEPVAVA